MAFQEEYDKLSTGEKNQFADTMNNLLFHCYIVRKRYDVTTGLDKVQYDYTFIDRHYTLFEEFLDFIDMTISKDDDSGVIFVRNASDKNRERVDTATTFVIYTLRDFYEEAIEKQPNILQVPMDSTQLRQRLSDLGLSTAAKRLSLQTISSSMKTLSSFNIIAKGRGTFNDNNYSFFILPSIKYIISTSKMNALYKFLTGEEEEEEQPTDLNGNTISEVTENVAVESVTTTETVEEVVTADKEEPEGF